MNGQSSASIDAAVSTVNCHPLEVIPVFRRVPRSAARDVVYTFIWNTLFAAFFTLIGLVIDPGTPVRTFALTAFVFAQCIGFFIYAGLRIGNRLVGTAVRRSGLWVRAAYHAIVQAAGALPGYWLALWILDWPHAPAWLFSPRQLVSIVALSLVIAAVLLLVFVPRERAARAEAARARDEARAAAAEREATMARMKLLEAQVEPHFLYNTLAHVVSLIDAAPPIAKRMIERLITLLRASASAPTTQSTLGAQIAWLTAYLEIIQLRMGARMRWRIDVQPSLYDLRILPMLLQPLVENAVRHGLEPAVDGGELHIGARRDANTLVLTVADTGVGFRETATPARTGIGLSNLRARLAGGCGDAATMTIGDVLPHGTRVTVTLPIPQEIGGAVTAAPKPSR